MSQQPARVFHASLGYLLCLRLLGSAPGHSGNVIISVNILLTSCVVHALDRGRFADPSRIKADHVVLVANLETKDPRSRRGKACSRASGSAGIEKERSHRFAALGGNLEHGDGDRPASGLLVVQRNLHIRALHAGTVFAFAFRPPQLLPIKPF